MTNIRKIGATALCSLTLAAATTATAAPSDSEAHTQCKASIQARLGEGANVELKRVRSRGGLIRVTTRVRGVDDGPSRLECRVDRDGAVVALFDPRAPAGSEFAAAP